MRISDWSSDVCSSDLLIGSLAICTVFYLLVAAGVIGSVGAQPMGIDAATGHALEPGSRELAAACGAIGDQAVVCSKEALAWSMREIGWTQVGKIGRAHV